MTVSKKIMGNLKSTLGLFALSSFVFVSSCNQDEATNQLTSDNISDLSSKSVKLPISSASLVASSSHSSYPAANAIDGSMSTRWTGNGVGTTLTINLERIDLVDYIKLAHHRGVSRVYKFEVYTRALTSDSWTKVGSKTSSGNSNALEIYDLTNTTARYIQIVSNGNTSNNWSDIVELEAYGTIGESVAVGCEATIPTNREANATGGSAVLSWDAMPYMDHYNVRYKKVENTSWIYVYSIESSSVTVSNINSGTDYEWQIRAKCPDGSASSYTDAKGVFTGGEGTSSGGNEEEEQEEEEENEGGSESEEGGATGGTPYSILGDVIKDWKITYPVDSSGNDSANADDCDDRNDNAYEQRDLTASISSEHSEYFFVSGDEVVFKAHVGGATTSGSSYPRSEFRQLVGGDDNYWSMEDYQYLEVRVRATHLPAEKPEVSMVQIHGPDDEPLRVEYREGSQGLHVVQNESNTVNYVLDYELGQELFVAVTVNNGNIDLYIRNEATGEVYTDDWEAEDSTGYFKVGCYTQSNNNLPTCKPGEGYSLQNPNEYGEVRIKDLVLEETY